MNSLIINYGYNIAEFFCCCYLTTEVKSFKMREWLRMSKHPNAEIENNHLLQSNRNLHRNCTFYVIESDSIHPNHSWEFC